MMKHERRIVTRFSWEAFSKKNPVVAGMAMNFLFGGVRPVPSGKKLMFEVYLADVEDKEETKEIPYKG